MSGVKRRNGLPLGTYEKVKPLPADKPLAPYRPPPAPPASKFRDIPGQGMLSLDEDEEG